MPPVWDKLKEIFLQPEVVLKEIEICNNENNTKENAQEELAEIRKKILSLSDKSERYAELYAEGSINKNFYDEKMQECNNKIEKLQKEELKISQLIAPEQEKEKQLLSIKELYGQLKDRLENATYELKREILQDLVEKIVKTGNKLEIEYRIPLVGEVALQGENDDCRDNRRMD